MKNDVRLVRWAIDKSARIISQREMRQAFRDSQLGALNMRTLDNTYRVASAESVKLFLEWSQVDRISYESEYFDCDDFAVSLRAEARRMFKLNSVGEVADLSGGHAYTAIAVHDGEDTPVRIMVIEPQTDGEITERTGSYQAKTGFAIF